jgi:hypothetical protein
VNAGDTTDGVESEVKAGLRHLCDALEHKYFRTGSQGAFKSGKVRISSGERFQAQVTAVLIGSKDDPTVTVGTSMEKLGFAIASVLETLEPRVFSTGRDGYFASGKAIVGRERFQVMILAVRIVKT